MRKKLPILDKYNKAIKFKYHACLRIPWNRRTKEKNRKWYYKSQAHTKLRKSKRWIEKYKLKN